MIDFGDLSMMITIHFVRVARQSLEKSENYDYDDFGGENRVAGQALYHTVVFKYQSEQISWPDKHKDQIKV